MEQLIEYFSVDKFSMLELLLWCAFVFGITLWGCVSAIKDNAKKQKKAQDRLVSEMHRMYLDSNPADIEERDNALSFLESLNVETKTPDGKA